MEIVIQPTAEAASVIAAHIVANLVREKPDCVLGLATGSTPVPLYRELARMHLLKAQCSCDLIVRARRDAYDVAFDRLREDVTSLASQIA